MFQLCIMMLQIQAIEGRIENSQEEQEKMRLCTIRDRANVQDFLKCVLF